MTREDFVFTIGYKDDEAIVDKRLKGKYRGYGTMELFREGLIRQAVASAVFAHHEGRDQDLSELLAALKENFGEELNEHSITRVYGISFNPDQIKKVLSV